MTMPAQKPGRSEQSVGTPRVFLDAVEARFGTITLDVAASPHNAVCERFIDEAQNGLTTPWDPDGLNWCNPPFGKIAPWVEKAYGEARDYGTRSLLLLPAGVGSNWWRDWVHDKAFVYLLNGRLTFVGHSTPYPKDLVLLEYGTQPVYSDAAPYYEVWDWRKPWVNPLDVVFPPTSSEIVKAAHAVFGDTPRKVQDSVQAATHSPLAEELLRT